MVSALRGPREVVGNERPCLGGECGIWGGCLGVPAAGCSVIWGGGGESHVGALGCCGRRSFLEGALGRGPLS